MGTQQRSKENVINQIREALKEIESNTDEQMNECSNTALDAMSTAAKKYFDDKNELKVNRT
ncbi:MAG: hypothetical protein ABI723_22075 [Bacteroidia bacterium]